MLHTGGRFVVVLPGTWNGVDGKGIIKDMFKRFTLSQRNQCLIWRNILYSSLVKKWKTFRCEVDCISLAVSVKFK